MLENGFVKLPREIVRREWLGDNATLTVYVFLLCGAAFRDVEREGYTIHKGQYVTSLKKLSEACRQSVRQTRTALSHLQATKDIAIQTTPKFSIITVNFMTQGVASDKRVDNLADTLVDKQNDNRSRIIEENKEEIKKEEYREEAAPPFTLAANNEISVETLIEQYGSATVRRYEEKFRKWAEGKNTSKISMYPTIAKWLAQDIGQANPKRGRALENSSIDFDEFERRLMEQYRQNGAQKSSEP